jgi:signal transduction histidine kinase
MSLVPEVQIGLFDKKLLQHIVGNLMSNAIKYSPGGGVVRLTVRQCGEATMMEVNDQGIGIPLDEVDHLFESFHRASNVGDIQGTGLGLAIVKNAVELHGGRISVSSQGGCGTCFTVHLNSRGQI